jgi:hypothetical protein
MTSLNTERPIQPLPPEPAMTATTEAPVTAANPLDRLTATVTAFPTWAEFAASMRGGYCPTLRGENRRNRILRKVVTASGFSYFDGRKVVR